MKQYHDSFEQMLEKLVVENKEKIMSSWPEINELKDLIEGGNFEIVIDFIKFLQDKNVKMNRNILSQICEGNNSLQDRDRRFCEGNNSLQDRDRRWELLHEFACVNKFKSLTIIGL